ncbi:hypothetical protein Hamer_G031772, partial [Homarus americanus]
MCIEGFDQMNQHTVTPVGDPLFDTGAEYPTLRSAKLRGLIVAEGAAILQVAPYRGEKFTSDAEDKTLLKKVALQIINEKRSKQLGASVSFLHYHKHSNTKYQYSRLKCLNRFSDVVAARIRLGSKPYWELKRNPSFALTECRIWDENGNHSLQHYCTSQSVDRVAPCCHLIKSLTNS